VEQAGEKEQLMLAGGKMDEEVEDKLGQGPGLS